MKTNPLPMIRPRGRGNGLPTQRTRSYNPEEQHFRSCLVYRTLSPDDPARRQVAVELCPWPGAV